MDQDNITDEQNKVSVRWSSKGGNMQLIEETDEYIKVQAEGIFQHNREPIWDNKDVRSKAIMNITYYKVPYTTYDNETIEDFILIKGRTVYDFGFQLGM